MTGVFADSFYFFALINRNDEAHPRTVGLSESLDSPLVTTTWVLTELADGLSRSSFRAMFSLIVKRLRADSRNVIVPASDALFDAGCDLYNARSDKQRSLTDCISFVVMQERGLTDALTGDHHFEQAGFRALLA
jgi:predicted nucleic acid-binding protein